VRPTANCCRVDIDESGAAVVAAPDSLFLFFGFGILD
jgi:hypothetical protein